MSVYLINNNNTIILSYLCHSVWSGSVLGRSRISDIFIVNFCEGRNWMKGKPEGKGHHFSVPIAGFMKKNRVEKSKTQVRFLEPDRQPDVADKKSLFRWLILGAPSTGKTSIQRRISQNEITSMNEYNAGLCEISAPPYTLRVWVTDFKAELRIESTHNVHGAILVFDINDRSSFNKLPEYMEFICTAGIRHVLIVGNKCDVAGIHRVTDVDIDNLKGRYSHIAIDFITVSAKTCENITGLFLKIAHIGFNAAEFDGKFMKVSVLRADYKSAKVANRLSGISLHRKRDGVKLTTHVKEGKNPVWNESFTIPIRPSDVVVFQAIIVAGTPPALCDPIELDGTQILCDKRVDMTLSMSEKKALHRVKDKGSLYIAFEPGYRVDSCHKLEFSEEDLKFTAKSGKLIDIYFTDPIPLNSHNVEMFSSDDEIDTDDEHVFQPSEATVDMTSYAKKMELGTGGFGRVELMTHRRTNENVAVKFIKANEGYDGEKFFKEVQIHGSLKHPSIVRLIGIALPTPPNFEAAIVMEYAPNGSLAAKMGKLSNLQKALIIIDIVAGFRYIHHKGIIHRDLKPTNILLDRDYHGKIGDFGGSGFDATETRTQTKVGTETYMAPEMHYEGEYDNKVDVYSFGITLHELVTGERPKFVVADLYIGKYPALPPNLTPLLQELITACWRFLPTERPSFTEICGIIKKHKFAFFDDVNPKVVERRYEEIKESVKHIPALASIMPVDDEEEEEEEDDEIDPREIEAYEQMSPAELVKLRKILERDFPDTKISEVGTIIRFLDCGKNWEKWMEEMKRL